MATIRGGEKLEQRLKDIVDKAGQRGMLRVGFLENARYPGGMPVAAVAAIQNYGAPKAKIPATHFFDNMVREKSPEWPEMLRAALRSSDFNVERALKTMGEHIAGDLRQAIVDVEGPPLSPITLMLRKMFGNHPEDITGKDVGEAARRVAAGEDPGGVSRKRLIWSGHLLQSVDYEVKT